MMSRLHHASFFSDRYIKLLTHRFLAILCLALLFSTCSDDSSVIDSTSPTSPLSFKNLALTTYVFDTDSISVVSGTVRKPEDPVTLQFRVSVAIARGEQQGARSIKDVRCTVQTEVGEAEKASVLLPGSNDAYSGNVSVPIRRGDVGEYRIIVGGTDDRGNEMTPIFTKIRVFFGKNPPTFCGIMAPDTVTRPDTGSTVMHIEACVSDLNGRADIAQVYFISYREPAQGSQPVTVNMFDDGTSGDRIAGDGQFSRDVILAADTIRNVTYRLEFHAIDHSNMQGNSTHRIYVR
jgi:hypothetical protein